MKDPKQGLLKQNNVLKWKKIDKKQMGSSEGMWTKWNDELEDFQSVWVTFAYTNRQGLDKRCWWAAAATSGGYIQLKKKRNQAMRGSSDVMSEERCLVPDRTPTSSSLFTCGLLHREEFVQLAKMAARFCRAPYSPIG